MSVVDDLEQLSIAEQLPSVPCLDMQDLSSDLLPAVLAFVECHTCDEAVDTCIDKFTDFKTYLAFRAAIERIFVPDLLTERISELMQKSYAKFPILVLVDLGGTIFFRTDKSELRQQGNFKRQKYGYFYRPGHREFLTRI